LMRSPDRQRSRRNGRLNSYHRFARGLIVLGGILGLVISLISLCMVTFMASLLGYGYGVIWQYGGPLMGKYDMFGYPQFGLDTMPIVMTVWSLLGLVGGSLSVLCGLSLRRYRTSNIIFISTIGGVLLLLSFSWLPSLMVLGGSLLLHFE
jgi:hypothetical protein